MERLPRRQSAIDYQHKPDSIEVSNNAKGEYLWKIKIYYNAEAGTAAKAHEKVTRLINVIDGDLRKKFK